MGYIEDCRDKKIEEFSNKLKELTKDEAAKLVFDEGLALVAFSCDYKSGFEKLKSVNSLLKEAKEYKKNIKYSTQKLQKEFKTAICNDKKISIELKEELVAKIDSICKNAVEKTKDRIKKLERAKVNLILRLFTSFVYVFMVASLFLVFYLLNCKNAVVKIVTYIFVLFELVAFVTWQVFYAIRYLEVLKTTRQGVVLYCIRKIFLTFLIIWPYLALFVSLNKWDSNIAAYSFVFIFTLYVVSLIYELFLGSSFFDDQESSVSLIIAVLIGLAIFMNVVDNGVVSKISGWTNLAACFLSSVLIIKKVMIDKTSVDNILKLYNLIAILLFTIVETIAALYLLFWVKPTDGQVVDNTLFSSIVGVYAAVIGGVLTLAGVAWTIKQTEKARKDDIERMENERKEEEKMKYRPLVFCLDPQHTTVRENLSVYFDNAISNKSIVIRNKGVQDFIVSQLFLRNADFSFSSLKGICVDDNLICFEIAQTLNKNQNYHILFNFGFCYKGKIEEFSLLLVDLLENYYILTTNFDIEGREIFVKSGIELIPVSIDFDNLKIIKRANAK